jgi:hypothetical protein
MNPELIVVLLAGLAVWTYLVAGVSEKEIERRRIASQSCGLFFGIVLGAVAAGLLREIIKITEAEWLQSYTWPVGIVVCCVTYARSVWKFVDGEAALRARLAAQAAAERAALLAPERQTERRPDFIITSHPKGCSEIQKNGRDQ